MDFCRQVAAFLIENLTQINAVCFSLDTDFTDYTDFFATEDSESTERASPAVRETAFCSKSLTVLEASFCVQS